MIVLLNILPIIILATGSYLSVRYKKMIYVVIGALVMLTFMFFRPSYMPKGEVKRSEIPEFIQSDKEIENRILSPKPGDEYDKKREEDVKKGLQFKTS